jgi:hypothetical protein
MEPKTISSVSDKATIRKTLATRAKAGNPGTHCPICGHETDRPFIRRNAQGVVTEGCVDAFHAASLSATLPGSYREWFHRNEARRCRRALLD